MHNKKHKIYFRADADNKIGLGHITRCTSLAEILISSFECIFITANNDDLIREMLKKYQVIYLQSSNLESELLELRSILSQNDIVVLDGYQFTEDYQQTIKQYVGKLVIIDDEANKHYFADLIINHGSSTAKNRYQRESYTRILTGFKYLVLRKPFLQHTKLLRTVEKVDSVFICMGGADPFNVTIKLVKACMLVPFVKYIDVLIGSAYSNKSELSELLKVANQSIDIKLHENLNAEGVANLIAANEICICPSSSISLEVASIQSGLLTGMVADNQKFIHQELLDSECCISLSDYTNSSEEILAEKISYLGSIKNVNSICANQFKLIDGRSGERLLNEFKLLVRC